MVVAHVREADVEQLRTPRQAQADGLVEFAQREALVRAGARARRTEYLGLFADRAAWGERALRNIAGMGPFSSDRTIAEYVDRVWSVKSLNP